MKVSLRRLRFSVSNGAIAMTSPRRTDFAAFILDFMDFIEKKIREAVETEASRIAARRAKTPLGDLT
jgi:hypothetical protein